MTTVHDARELARLDAEVARLDAECTRLRQALSEAGDAVACDIARWLLDMRFSKPGREAEWSRHIARQIIDGAWRLTP